MFFRKPTAFAKAARDIAALSSDRRLIMVGPFSAGAPLDGRGKPVVHGHMVVVIGQSGPVSVFVGLTRDKPPGLAVGEQLVAELRREFHTTHAFLSPRDYDVARFAGDTGRFLPEFPELVRAVDRFASVDECEVVVRLDRELVA